MDARLRRLRSWFTPSVSDRHRTDHGTHHNREPGHRRNESNLTGKSCASEDCAGCSRAKDDIPATTMPMTKGDQRPRRDSHARCDDDEVYDIDGEAHSASLRASECVDFDETRRLLSHVVQKFIVSAIENASTHRGRRPAVVQPSPQPRAQLAWLPAFEREG